MSKAWIIVNKTDGKPKVCRTAESLAKPTGVKTVTVFLSRRIATKFLDEHERVQRVRVTAY